MKKKLVFNPLTGQFDLISKVQFRADGNAYITSGDLTLISGTNVTLTQVGDTIQIDANGSAPPVLTGYIGHDEFANVGPGNQTVFGPLNDIPFDGTQLIVKVDGVFLLPTDYSYNSGTNEVTITAGIAPAQMASISYSTGLNNLLFNNEVLTGTVDGVNRVFTLSTSPLDIASVLLLVNGKAVPKADYTAAGNTITFNPGNAPAPGQAVHAVYQYDGTVLSSAHEVPLGARNGSNTVFGPLRFDPNEFSSVSVLVDGIEVGLSEYSLLGKSLQFTTPPATGQDVSVYYYFAEGTNKEQVQYITLNQSQIDAKSVQLEFTPREPTEVLLDVVRSGCLEYGEDFIVSENTISWDGLAFEADAVVGMKLRIYYII